MKKLEKTEFEIMPGLGFSNIISDKDVFESCQKYSESSDLFLNWKERTKQSQEYLKLMS